MQGTYYQTGDSIDYTPATAKNAGDVVVQEDLVGVCETDIAAAAKGALAVKGAFKFYAADDDSSEISIGEKIYWDEDGDPSTGTAGTGCATTTATGNKFMGHALQRPGKTAADAAKETTDGDLYVRLQQTSPADPSGS